ncbi:MAG: 16S rRNA (cytosine(1402)-N(4))-methyltransferase RsmH [Candidatus Alcyoniella australis]|nr:16S rRNA (cytosine(1402)-N(4))-methyltransferase RsmH [Candidatus Alcyoniella australis]
MSTGIHLPVLLEQTIELIKPAPGSVFLDATVGAGGHSEAMLRGSAPDGRLVACDADPEALARAGRRLEPFGSRVELVHCRLDELSRISCNRSWPRFVGILADLGLSSIQLDDPERGFSFSHDGPLDMRLCTGSGRSAADLVNQEPYDQLRRIIAEYGEERYASRVARAIVRERDAAPIRSTGRLAQIVRSAIPGKRGPQRIDPATRTFQGLRIAVNDELGSLRSFLADAPELLAPGGVLAVISFHSLEDRLVKQALRRHSSGCLCPPAQPVCTCGHLPSMELITRRPIRPDQSEIERNPRSRSARLRAARRLEDQAA